MYTLYSLKNVTVSKKDAQFIRVDGVKYFLEIHRLLNNT